MLKKSKFRRYLEALLLLRENYRDWPLIVLLFLIRQHPNHVMLRQNPKITLPGGTGVRNLVGLSRLLRAGWKVASASPNWILIASQENTIFKARLGEGDARDNVDLWVLSEIFV